MSNLKVSIHVIRSIPPSNLNRDKNGLPKITTMYGGEHLRISSQSLKNAIRFEYLGDSNGIRSRELDPMIVTPLVEKGHSVEDAWLVVRAFVPLLLGGLNKEKDTQLGAMVFLTCDELNAIVDELHNNFDVALADIGQKGVVKKGSVLFSSAKRLTKQFSAGVSALDVAMFGRMLAVNHDIDVSGAVSVAHAVSTHEVSTQEDWFNGMDDLAGVAGMLETAYFNSATIYEHFTVDWNQLVENLGGDCPKAEKGLAAFLKGAALSLPSGKKHSFLAFTPPGLLFIEIRWSGDAFSYANAFEPAVRSSRDGGFVAPSASAFADYLPYAYRFSGRPDYAAGMIGSPAVERALNETLLDPKIGTLAHWFENIDDLVADVAQRASAES